MPFPSSGLTLTAGAVACCLVGMNNILPPFRRAGALVVATLVLARRIGKRHASLGNAERLEFSVRDSVFDIDQGIPDAHHLNGIHACYL